MMIIAGLAMFAVGCGDDATDADAEPGSTTSAPSSQSATSTTLTPQRGGTVTVGQFAALNGFDPANVTIGASTNGLELGSLYDTLLRFDTEKSVYVPRVASSLEHNADYTQFTIKLKPGVTFTDGTAYDAAAVKASIERHMTSTSKSSSKPALLQFVASITAADAQTVVFQLKQAWAGFPFLLTIGPGMITSPAAVAKAGENFNTAPGDAGAGPFKLQSFKPGEELVFVRNPGYHGGDVYLDQLRFVQAGGAPETYLALQNNSLQAAYLRDPVAIAQAEGDGFHSQLLPAPGGNIALFNAGVVVTCAGGAPAPVCTGKPDGEKVATKPPTADLKVRLAIAHAIDRKAINERVWQGKGEVGDSILLKSSPFYSDVKFPEYNLAEAKRLVQEAKAAGWDGRIRVLAANDSATWGQTMKTLMETAGMTVDLNVSQPLAAVIQQVIVRKDFDVASWGAGMYSDDSDFFNLTANWSSASARYGFGAPDYDGALDKLRLAGTADQKKDAYKALSEAWAKGLPALPIATQYAGLVQGKKVHGVTTSAFGLLLLDKMWIEK
jgi:peptide/nickel transport system substrate-binding protein